MSPEEAKDKLKSPLISAVVDRAIALTKAHPQYSGYSIVEITQSVTINAQTILMFIDGDGVEISDAMIAAVILTPVFGLSENAAEGLDPKVVTISEHLGLILGLAYEHDVDVSQDYSTKWKAMNLMIPGKLIFEEKPQFIAALKALALNYYNLANAAISYDSNEQVRIRAQLAGNIMFMSKALFGEEYFNRGSLLDEQVGIAKNVITTYFQQQNAQTTGQGVRPGEEDGF